MPDLNSTDTQGKLQKLDRLLAALVFLAALVLRVFRIGQESFFIDEGFSLITVREGLMNHLLTVEATPPLYFMTLKVWVALLGDSHEAIRLLSAVCGAAACGFVVLACRRWNIGRVIATSAGLALALSAQSIWYGQQARSYAMVMMWVPLWLMALAPSMAHIRRRSMLLGLVLFLGFATHYYFALIAAGGAAWMTLLFLVRGRKDPGFKTFIWGHTIGVVLCLPVVYLAWLQFNSGTTSWTPSPKWLDLRDLWVRHFFVGTATSPPVWIAWLGVVLVASIAGWAGWRAFRSSRKDRLQSPSNAFAVATGAVLLAVVIPLVFSIAGPRSVFMAYRYSVVSLPAFVFGMAAGLDSIPCRRIKLILGVMLGLVVYGSSLMGLIPTYRDYQDFDWRGAIRIVEQEWEPGDTVVFLPRWQRVTWESNGGGEVPSPGNPETRESRIWLLTWLGNDNEQELELSRQLMNQPGARVRVDFPHIKLVEVPEGGH